MPIPTDLEHNWGIMVGTNVSDVPGCTLASSYRTLSLELSGSPLDHLRVVIHRRGDAARSNTTRIR